MCRHGREAILDTHTKDFHFRSEKTSHSAESVAERTENFSFFLKLSSILSFLFGLGLFFGLSEKEVDEPRNQNTVPVQAVNKRLTPLVKLGSFLIRLKTETGFRLTKVEIALQVNSSAVTDEIQNSLPDVREHLIFILSAQNTMNFVDSKRRAFLEKEIINQLNWFLIAGKVEKVELKEIFLN